MNNLNSIITSKGLSDLSTEYGELVIDGFLEDGILKDIPIIGSVLKLVSFGNSINEKIFIKKVYNFLFQLRKTDEKDRIRFIEDLDNSEKYQSKVGEAVFEIIDKIDSEGKPPIIGKMFAATIRGQIDYIDFLRVSHIVTNQFYFDLAAFKDHVDNGNLEGASISEFFSGSGLTTYDFLPAFENALGNENNNPARGITEYGKILLNIGMLDKNTKIVY